MIYAQESEVFRAFLSSKGKKVNYGAVCPSTPVLLPLFRRLSLLPLLFFSPIACSLLSAVFCLLFV
jgi:hypothetical protein